MPAHRMNMSMIKDVLRLKFDGDFAHDLTCRPWPIHSTPSALNTASTGSE
ncbi:hypothetical protein ABIC49_004636 [Burkholderia ambifaria]